MFKKNKETKNVKCVKKNKTKTATTLNMTPKMEPVEEPVQLVY